ncbi:hypothetical protein K439DRAFT_258906 [Ramaria rubella]|nr:hypothetical protein K439DRAFT_258906 [Ramaria rubella]
MSLSYYLSTKASETAMLKQELLPLSTWDENFVECYLPSVALETTTDLSAFFAEQISAITLAFLEEASMCGPISKLLNRLSEAAYHLLHNGLASNPTSCAHLLSFD